MNVSATGIPSSEAKVRKRAGGVRAHGAVPGQRDRARCRADDLRRPPQLAHPGLGLDRRVAGEGDRVERARHHVLGQLQVRGARLLGLGDRERLADHLGYDFGARYPRVPLDDRAQDADQIYVLVRFLVHPLQVGLAGECDERGSVQVGVGHGSDEVRRARSEGAEAHARSARQPPVGVGHVGAALLVPNRNELNRRIGQRLAQIERLLARNPEHEPNALRLQALDEHI